MAEQQLDGSPTAVQPMWLTVCPRHGILSEREATESFEMGVNYWGESCGPYGCPLTVEVPVPTTASRERPKLNLMRLVPGEPWRPTSGAYWTDPGWTSVECARVLDDQPFVPYTGSGA